MTKHEQDKKIEHLESKIADLTRLALDLRQQVAELQRVARAFGFERKAA